MKRPDWDLYFLLIAQVAALRSTCIRRQVGAVLVKDKQILSTGYNGSPARTRHCDEVGCLRQQMGIPSGERHEICRGSHAEINAIVQAAAVGAPTRGSCIYCTTEPCSFCTKAIINAGCTRMVFVEPYPDELARQLREEAGIEVVCVPREQLVRMSFEECEK